MLDGSRYFVHKLIRFTLVNDLQLFFSDSMVFHVGKWVSNLSEALSIHIASERAEFE
jgi:hypothetical protein